MAMSTTTAEQKNTTQSCVVKLDSKGDLQVVSLNLNPIQWYAAELWETLSERDTAVTYKQAIVKTLKLLAYLLALLFFVFLFLAALIISIWGIGFNLGVQFQEWLESAGEYNLNLIPLDSDVGSADALPNEGKNWVIAAKIDDNYHVRIFDRYGNKIYDKGGGEFLPDAALAPQLEAALVSPPTDKQTKDNLILGILKSAGLGYTGRQSGEFFDSLSHLLFGPIQAIVKWANQYVEKYLPGWKPSNSKSLGSTEEE